MEENTLIVVAIVVGALAVIAVVWAVIKYSAAQRERRREALALVAAQIHGEVTVPGRWAEPMLVWQSRDRPAALVYYSTGGKHPVYYTRLLYTLDGPPPIALRIYPEGVFQKLGKKLGFQDVPSGDPRFDGAFIVKAGDELRARMVLGDAGFREALLQLRDLGKSKHAALETQKKGVLQIEKLQWLEAPEELRSMVALGDQVLAAYLRSLG